ncbi:uncharacterized protein LOC108913020 [Anoplophora glabripennis]|uniref:uncharacterized protein LOC108913020 n=1 Tax=Anoplophora glabripennis TaxID=217634 RepID=UPI000C7641DD|nr:uncharacterized protein LOC108913020 [Anoplophora glabripennis]
MHIRLCHPGPRFLLSSIREQFWPIGGKQLAKKITRECITCFRCKPTSINPIMGSLPPQRTEMTYPFYCTGVDYAGPYLLKDKQGRGNKTTKCFISLFICFATKAIHLELVTGLSTEAFLAAFKRFIARRGKPARVYSDNGKTFIGANNEMQKIGEFLKNNSSSITNYATNESIEWHFIPPYSPNFGGLWEAGVKSMKHHLKRILKNINLTYEDFSTLITQIESLLNSRPLFQLSTDPNDFGVLTPAHFLIGRSFTSIPDPNFLNVPENRLSRFQHIQKMVQHFWSTWSKEYIHELQQRSKWNKTTTPIKNGTLALIKRRQLTSSDVASRKDSPTSSRQRRSHPSSDSEVRYKYAPTSKTHWCA